MALISFMAGGMIAFVTAGLAWLVGDASAATALKLYAIIAFGVPLALIAFRTLQPHRQTSLGETNARHAYISE